MAKSNTAVKTTESETPEVQGFDFVQFFTAANKNKSKTIKHMATLPEFQKDGKPDMGKINKVFNDQPDDIVPAPKMRYQFVRNVLTAKPKKD